MLRWFFFLPSRLLFPIWAICVGAGTLHASLPTRPLVVTLPDAEPFHFVRIAPESTGRELHREFGPVSAPPGGRWNGEAPGRFCTFS